MEDRDGQAGESHLAERTQDLGVRSTDAVAMASGWAGRREKEGRDGAARGAARAVLAGHAPESSRASDEHEDERCRQNVAVATTRPAADGADLAIRIFVAAPVRLYRDGLAETFRTAARFEVCGSAATASETLAHVREEEFDIVLVDSYLPGAGALVREIAQRRSDTKVVVLGVEEAEEEILPLVEAGIAGYVTREGSLADLKASVECAVRRESVASPRIVATLMQRVASLTLERTSASEPGPLTTRERQIASLIEEGLSNRDIARRLDIGLPTVKNHVHNILEKLHVHRRGEAVARLRSGPAKPINRRRGS